MQLKQSTVATLFEINSPIWNGEVGKRVVGLARWRLGIHNEIRFMYRRKSDGELSIPGSFYFAGMNARKYKIDNRKGTELVLVPFADLEPLIRVSADSPAPANSMKADKVIIDEAAELTDDQLDMFNNDVEKVETAPASRRAMNAIKWLCNKGYRPAIGGLRNLKKFELTNKDTGEIEKFDIEQVLSDYDQDRKDEARMKAAARRAERKQFA